MGKREFGKLPDGRSVNIFVLKNANGLTAEFISSLYHPKSGRFMEVFSDQPALQFYSGNFLDGSVKGKYGKEYQFRCGLCLETQHLADAPNHPEFPSIVLKPGERYKQTTKYKFSLK